MKKSGIRNEIPEKIVLERKCMSKKNDNLYRYSKESPWRFVLVVILYVIGAASFPSDFFGLIPENAKALGLLSVFLSRSVCSAVTVWLMFEIKTQSMLGFNKPKPDVLKALPFFLVALNNVPFFALHSGSARISEDVNFGIAVAYALACLGGVVLEETAFRGLVFPAILRKLEGKKNGVFLSVFLSSLFFGITHIVNLFGGASIGAVVMQVGYSFLVGGMCATALYITGNIYCPVALHFIYNIGGLATGYGIIEGNIWTVPQIAATAVVAAVVFVYAVIVLTKTKNPDICERDLKIPS